MTLAASDTAVTVTLAKSLTFTVDTTAFELDMDPSLPALADQSATVGLTVQTNANSGYTLSVADSATGLQSSATGNPVIGSVGFPRDELTIPAQSYLDVPLTIQVPARLSPDLYFVGFLVTPVATGSGSLHVINQIGSFVTIDVPGPRVRALTASFQLPSLSFGSRARGTVRIANTGRSAVRFWGEQDTRSAPGGSAVQQRRFDPSLLPAGKHRFVDVSAKPAWPIGTVTMTVHLVYPGRTEAATKELVVTKRVLVINPLVPAALALALLIGVLLVWRRRRRRPGELRSAVQSAG